MRDLLYLKNALLRRIASREILPAGKILALFSSTHGYICRKVSARFVLLLVLPIDLFCLRPRVRYLMKEAGGYSLWWLSPEIPQETRSHAMVRGEVASCSVVSQKTGAIHPLVALQVEYSLMQRTGEGELIPMAQELALGVLPSSPLQREILSGKYTRENHPTTPRHRGAIIELTDKDYTIIDQLQKMASDLDTAVPTVALAWVQSQPGVTSTIIGARTMEHLEANLKALDVHLTPEQIATLNAASRPVLNFPAEFNANRSPNYAHAGATVNGSPSKPFDIVPTNGLIGN
jgi:hypothetical protein